MQHRHPEFEASIAEAKVRPEIWRLLLGIAILVFTYLGGTLLILAVAGAFVAKSQGPFGLIPFFQEMALGNTPGHLMLMLTTFVPMFAGGLLAAAACHFRGPGSIFGDFGEWLRGFLVGLAVTFVILGGLVAFGFWLDPPMAGVDWGVWLKWLPLALVLLFFQTGAEEVVFRGYLQQQLAARFASRIVWMWLPAILFALLHWTPEAGPHLALVILGALTFGLIAADLTERTGSLGAAMGIHFANNFLALFILALAPDLRGLALYVSTADLAEIGLVTVGLVVNIIMIFVVWWAAKTLLVVQR